MHARQVKNLSWSRVAQIQLTQSFARMSREFLIIFWSFVKWKIKILFNIDISGDIQV